MEANRLGSDRVIFDTNALIYAVKNKLDFSNLKIVVPKAVLDELKRLESKLSGEEKTAVRIALKLIENFEFVDSSEGDEGILETAKKLGCGIITNDKELRRKAEKLGLAVGYIKLGKIVF
ncbi:MAG: PIN domain-containing protein [Archaeoglobaceae archaeon]|nr:PIN domain-containing protein [Archaeoglobaceae archaeon]MDW8127812.1 PIN domain-containing protein [Archaeoglobaceae archaeon]